MRNAVCIIIIIIIIIIIDHLSLAMARHWSLVVLLSLLQAALMACQSLKARLDKVKDGLVTDGIPDPTWLQTVQKAFSNGVDLSEKY